MSIDPKPDSTYTTQAGESLMGIALRQLGDKRRWEEIRDANATRFPDMDPHDYYPVGTELVMPSSAPPAVHVQGEREVFEAWGERLFFSSCFEREDGDSYASRGLQGAWLGWQARAALCIPPAAVAQTIQEAFKDGYRTGVHDEFVNEEAAWNRSRSIHAAHHVGRHGAIQPTPPAAQVQADPTDIGELFTDSICPACGDTGWLIVDDSGPGKMVTEPCPCKSMYCPEDDARAAQVQGEREAFELRYPYVKGLGFDGKRYVKLHDGAWQVRAEVDANLQWSAWQARTTLSAPPAAGVPEGLNYKFKFETLVDHCKRQDQTIADLRYDENIRRFYDEGAVWFWCGDETDNLETLACPVVINAGDLRALLATPTPPASEQQQAVVLPERKQFPDPDGFATMPEWYARQHIEASTHNACLDELLRLNPHLQPAPHAQGGDA